MKYRNTFIQSHDIDIIFKVNDIVIHAASNGMPIMDAVNDVEINRDNFEKIYTLPDITDDEGVEINDGYLRDIWGFYLRGNVQLAEDYETFRSNYIPSFVEMARKGLWSYDFDMIDYEASLRRGNNNGTLGYSLICRPKDPKNYLSISDDSIPCIKSKYKLSSIFRYDKGGLKFPEWYK